MDTASPAAILSSFPLSRAAATGAPHVRLRNIDRGPGDHQHISRLSAALRRRLISEDEIVSAVLDQHGLSPATAGDGVHLAEQLRGRDCRAWPYCRKGFFTLKEQISMLLSAGDAS